MSARITVRHRRTGEELEAYRDPEGLWLDDPMDPGYAMRPQDWQELR